MRDSTRDTLQWIAERPYEWPGPLSPDQAREILAALERPEPDDRDDQWRRDAQAALREVGTP